VRLSSFGRSEMVSSITQKGADVTSRDLMGGIAFNPATRDLNIFVIYCLVRLGADINFRVCMVGAH
jgi:ankyrin repeat protein